MRANREASLLSNLLNLAVECGELDANPCKQIRRNKEQPRRVNPAPDQIAALVDFAMKKGGQWEVIVMAAEFASLAGPRQIEFLGLEWDTGIVGNEVRMARGKQRKGALAVIDVVEMSQELADLVGRLRARRKNDCQAVFPNRFGNPYTASGFKGQWGKLRAEAIAAKAITQHFTFHDLRAYYATQHKKQTGEHANLHKNPATTSRIYDREIEAPRRSI